VQAVDRPNFRAGLRLEGWTLIPDGKFTDCVWQVEHNDGRIGVIKTARGKRPVFLKRFEWEVSTLVRLQSSPGVLRLLDRDTSSSPRWMVTEIAESLAGHLGSTPRLGDVVSAFADIADTLVDAKARGVSHRDIKPDNLFFTRGRSVVGDFGLATGHDSPGLTGHGERVGPANFCAPEALEAHEAIDWSRADLYALAKSFWAVLAGAKYPPQGPMFAHRPECGLERFGGSSAEGLARLLEIATEESPSDRPTLSEFRDELRTWLRVNPATSVPEPGSISPSAAEVDARGPLGIVDDAVHKVLLGCRRAGPTPGQILDDPTARVALVNDPRATAMQDSTSGHIAVKKLSWSEAGNVRLVAAGVLERRDDLLYSLSWQRRATGGTSWEVTWQAEGRVRARLPSDIAERARLADEAIRHRPALLADPPRLASSDTEDLLRGVTARIRHREDLRHRDLEDTRRRTETREQMVRKAREGFATFWGKLAEFVSVAQGDIGIRLKERDDTWFLTMGDRRVVAWVGYDATPSGPGLLLGTVTVETEGEDDSRLKCDVANVCAVVDSSGEPIWQLLRFQRNDFVKPAVPVAESCFDGCGAVLHATLDQLLQTGFEGQPYPAATLVSRDPLTVDTMMRVVLAEMNAVDRRFTAAP